MITAAPQFAVSPLLPLLLASSATERLLGRHGRFSYPENVTKDTKPHISLGFLASVVVRGVGSAEETRGRETGGTPWTRTGHMMVLRLAS